MAALTLGCGGATEPAGSSEPESGVVADFKRESGFAFERCPGIDFVHRPCEEDCYCSPEWREAGSCLITGFDACKPVQLTVRQLLGDEGWIVTDFLVVPRGESGCSVVQFHDFTHVEEHCHFVSRTACTGITLEDTAWRCGLTTSGSCGDRVQVVSDPRPFCSMGP